MYCKKCHNILNDDEYECQKCGYDNLFTPENSLEETEYKPQNKKNTKSIIIGLLLVIIGVTTVYIFRGNQTMANIEEQTPTIIETEELINNFEFNELTLSYSNSFGTLSDTIFYKNNNSINIEFKMLTIDEYENIINSIDTLSSKIGEIETLTYAEENSYSHIFLHNETIYNIKVNYPDNNEFDEATRLEVSKVLNSINYK